MGAFFGAIFAALLGIFMKPRSTEAEVKQGEVSTLTEDLKSNVAEEKALAGAAAARAAADTARIVRDPDADRVTTDPRAAVNTDPDANFRD